MTRNINIDHHNQPAGVIHPMMNGGNRKMMPPALSPEERVKGLEDVLRKYELKTAGPEEELRVPPKGSFVVDGLASEGPMLTESAFKEATAKEPTLMESLIDLSAAIQEDERLTTRLEQLSSPKESTSKEPALQETTPKGPTSKGPSLKEPAPMDLLIDLNAEGIAVRDWVKAGPNQLSTAPKERAACKEPSPKKHMPMDLLVELSAEERGGTLHSVNRDQGWLKVGPEQLAVPKEPALKEPARKEPVRKEPTFKEPARKEPAPKGATSKEAARKEPAFKEFTRKEASPKEPARKEPTRNEPSRKEPTRKEPARKEPTRKGHTRKEPYRKEPYRKEPYRKDPYRKEPYRKEPYRKEPYCKEPYRKEPTRKEPNRKEPAPKEPAFKEPAFKEPAFKESTPMGTLIDLSNVPRTKVAPLPPMLHGIRHLLGIQRTYEKAVPVFSAIPALVPAKKYDYPSPTSVQGNKLAPKYSSTPAPPNMRNQLSTPPPHMRILSMAGGAATPPHMRAPSENSSLTRSLSPASSSSRSQSPAPVKLGPAKPAPDQSGRYFLNWANEVPDYAWTQGTQRGEEREW